MNDIEKRYAEFRATVPKPPPEGTDHAGRHERERNTERKVVPVEVEQRRREGFHAPKKPRPANEPLFACPHCGRSGFSKLGIKHHRCPKLPLQPNGMRSRLDLAEVLKITGEE